MTADEALRFVELLLSEQNKRLNDTERIVFRGAWNDEIYEQICRNCRGRSIEHIKRNIGPRLWQKISQAINAPLSKTNLQGPIEQAFLNWQARQTTAIAPSSEPPVEPPVELQAVREAIVVSIEPVELPFHDIESIESSARDRDDWYRFMPDVPLFVGRSSELEQLAQQIRLGSCRVLTLCGLSGVGKTALAASLGEAVRDLFEVRIWRSIAHRPSLKALHSDLQIALSDRPGQARDGRSLLDRLCDRPCLIVLDGYEALLQSGVHDGAYLDGYAEYGQWLETIGQTMHQSCIILTSREEPKEIAHLKEAMTAVQSVPVRGLRDLSVRNLFQRRGNFSGSEGDWWLLTRLYDGNPAALNEAAAFIRDVYGGNLAAFVRDAQDQALSENTRSQIEAQLARLSALEHQIVRYLCSNQLATFAEIRAAVRSRHLTTALKALRRRSLIEIHVATFELNRLLGRFLRDSTDTEE